MRGQHQADVESSVARVLDYETTVVSMEAADLDGLWGDIRRVGEALAVDADPLVRTLQSRLEDAIPESTERPRVVCLEWIEPLMFAGNWVPELVTLAGGIDLFGSPGAHSSTLEWSTIAESDPDVIVLMPCGYDLERTRQEIPLLERLDGWRDLRAVREGRIYVTDGNHYFNRPGPRLVDSLEILVEILHDGGSNRFGHRGIAWAQADPSQTTDYK